MVKPDEARVWEALRDVTDPEMPISLVDMGMVYGVCVEGDRVRVQLGLTATACPAMEFICQDVRERLQQEGFDQVEIEFVWDPPWTKERMTEEGKIALRHWGVSV
ncbi:MAG: metal-sulfur cluster assembly factor [Candidatus Bipolaricaulota bacterium]|nr:metal-sulfur cluster assembly factor [Candidatus Bipolaricaulota bacterium]MCS7275340.1 metal-sulfur cluster assembly factor [Candidatus Bipolaricaulota bacterium]MDW8110161.1 metal-sulfur cluster assembly factor [Candidatus Bipolaricaulota bacterium]MDW8329193.1 metal-sulfur cluster assembly factor [Candidatus Bipolaricaulota bacterium]